jgi:hypothetical protein
LSRQNTKTSSKMKTKRQGMKERNKQGSGNRTAKALMTKNSSSRIRNTNRKTKTTMKINDR